MSMFLKNIKESFKNKVGRPPYSIHDGFKLKNGWNLYIVFEEVFNNPIYKYDEHEYFNIVFGGHDNEEGIVEYHSCFEYLRIIIDELGIPQIGSSFDNCFDRRFKITDINIEPGDHKISISIIRI